MRRFTIELKSFTKFELGEMTALIWKVEVRCSPPQAISFMLFTFWCTKCTEGTGLFCAKSDFIQPICAFHVGGISGFRGGSETDALTLVTVAISLLGKPLVAKLTCVGLGAKMRTYVVFHIGKLREGLLAHSAGELAIHSLRTRIHLVEGAPLRLGLLVAFTDWLWFFGKSVCSFSGGGVDHDLFIIWYLRWRGYLLLHLAPVHQLFVGEHIILRLFLIIIDLRLTTFFLFSVGQDGVVVYTPGRFLNRLQYRLYLHRLVVSVVFNQDFRFAVALHLTQALEHFVTTEQRWIHRWFLRWWRHEQTRRCLRILRYSALWWHVDWSKTAMVLCRFWTCLRCAGWAFLERLKLG